jgi:hypothetical protein
MQRSMDEEGVLCSAGAAWVEITKALPPQLGKGTRAKPPHQNAQGTLPGVLRDLRPLPPTVPQPLRERERGTYYWLYRWVVVVWVVVLVLVGCGWGGGDVCVCVCG